MHHTICQQWLADVPFEMPLASPTVIAVWLPNTWQHSTVMASHWVGLTLPGMIEEPGSFSGNISSPRPERGPDPNSRISLAISNRPVATELTRAVRENIGVVGGQRLEF